MNKLVLGIGSILIARVSRIRVINQFRVEIEFKSGKIVSGKIY